MESQVQGVTSPAAPRCPACGAHAAAQVLRIEDAPVTTATVFDSAGEARAVPRGVVQLVACQSCGFIFNAQFDERLAEAGARYESSQGASAHFGAFARGLATDWVERYLLAGRTVVEVGSGHGEFLTQMLAAGAGRGLGVDPVADSARIAPENRAKLELLADKFESHADVLPGAALVCRHTLEHIGDLRSFLAALHRWCSRSPERVALFEVPASERVIAEAAFWDVYYEHCNYFTAATLQATFERAGFEVLRSQRLFGDQYLIFEVRAGVARHQTGASADAAVSEALAFGRAAPRAIEACRAAIARCRSDGALVLWQGAAKAVGLLTALGKPHGVDFAVDLSRGRHDKFLPGAALQVFAPDVLRMQRPPHVVLMNPVYAAEVRAELDRLTPATRLQTINELCASG
jgi:hypothetical protein